MNIETKISRIVASCETAAHLKVAVKYIVLANKQQLISNNITMYWVGVIKGIAHVKGVE